MRYDVYSPAKNIKAHILMPKSKICSKLLVNSREMNFSVNKVGASIYLDFDINNIDETPVSIEVLF